jgi:hypothetical protein
VRTWLTERRIEPKMSGEMARYCSSPIIVLCVAGGGDSSSNIRGNERVCKVKECVQVV